MDDDPLEIKLLNSHQSNETAEGSPTVTRLYHMSGDDQLESDWRGSITRQLENITKLQSNVALLVERLDGRMTAAENNIKDLKDNPNAIRGNLGVILQAGGCFGSVVFAFMSLTSIIISVAVLVLHH